jgi:hypothetical protein
MAHGSNPGKMTRKITGAGWEVKAEAIKQARSNSPPTVQGELNATEEQVAAALQDVPVVEEWGDEEEAAMSMSGSSDETESEEDEQLSESEAEESDTSNSVDTDDDL